MSKTYKTIYIKHIKQQLLVVVAFSKLEIFCYFIDNKNISSIKWIKNETKWNEYEIKQRENSLK